MTALTVTTLAGGYHGRPVLHRLDLQVPQAGFTAILGASGSGKTTLLRLICGFERPTSGSIAIDGRMVAAPGLFIPPERRGIGYVAQDGALFPHLSVARNILFGLRRSERTAARAADLLRLVGLPPHYADRPPQALSGGEQQRVALARALAPAPRLVLLDEPFSALDAALRVETRRAVAHALAQVGAAAVLVTHDQGEALSMGHTVAVLRDGALVQMGPPAELYRHPVDSALARFVGEAVLLDGTATGRSVHCGLGDLIRAGGADGPVEVLIRPEQIRLLDPSATRLAGIVTEVSYYGHDASVRLDMGKPGLPRIVARISGQSVPPIGTSWGIAVEGEVVSYPR